MALKIDIEDLEMILAASKVPQDKQKIILEEAKALVEQEKELTEKKNRVKNRFLVMPIVLGDTEVEQFQDRSYVIIQAPEELSDSEVQLAVERNLIDVVKSQRGKKYNITTVSNAISKIKAKDLVVGDYKIKLKTKIPVVGIPVINNISV
jgi:hypothetical protein